jgi:hypothetical protein
MINSRIPNNAHNQKIASPGPFLAKVVNNVDPMRQGSLEVELLRGIGNNESANQQTFVVRYLSPFYGVTDIEMTGTDPSEFNHTQKSYGFWMVPPDTGAIVMVIFVDNDPGQGFWMGCVQDTYMNHMVPGLAASESTQDQYREADAESWNEVSSTQEKFGTKNVPVGEFNRSAIRSGNLGASTLVDSIKKPVHPITEKLFEQGTLEDTVRGIHTHSARRESPSNVYGISTPGPKDKRRNAQKGNIGRADNKINTFISRLGGHSLVMDDGNDRKLRKTKPWEGPAEYADLEAGDTDGLVEYPQDEAFRIRTRTGHQILLHNSEDLIYITNSRGTAWIEMTSNGKIDIYAQDSISIRTEQDFNLVAERDFNVHANRSVNFHAGTACNISSVNNSSISSGTGFALNCPTGFDINTDAIKLTGTDSIDIKTNKLRISSTTTDFLTAGNAYYTAFGNLEVNAGNATLLTSGTSLFVLSGSSTYMTQANLEVKTSGDNVLTSGGTAHIKAGGNVEIKASGSVNNDGSTINLKAGTINTSKITGDITYADQTGVALILGAASPTGDTAASSGARDAIASAQSRIASSAVEAATSGGTSEGGSGAELVLFPLPGVGQVLVKRAPTKEPYEHHESSNPPGFTPELTDREAADMPYALESTRLSILRSSDAEDVPAELGGSAGWGGSQSTGAGGGTAYASSRAGANADATTSYTGRPPSQRQLSAWPSDWAKDTEFLGEVAKLSGKYGCSEEDMLAFMHFETAHTMRPDIQNSLGYTGLIQFGRLACQDLSKKYKETITTGILKQMSRTQQMKWVERYFDMWISRLKIPMPLTIERMYLLVAYPAFSNKPEDAVIAGPNGPNKSVWRANPAWRDNRGVITVRSVGKSPRACIAHVRAQLQQAGVTGTSSPTTNQPTNTGTVPGAGAEE